MIDENEGYTGGMSGIVYRTVDGGDNWEILGSMASTLIDIDFATATQGYACGFGGAVFSITPGGAANLNSGLASDLSGISSPSVNNVWVCGGAVISYYNGTSFSFQSGPAGSYNSIFFINDQEGWVVGTAGLIGHTVNGGDTWTSQTSPNNNSLYDVFFLDVEVGWAVGSQGTILYTANGGDTWSVQGTGLTTAFLRGVHFTSPSNGYVVGNDKTLLKYSELLGIGEETKTLQCNIFPNPAKDKLQIKCSDFNIEKGTIVILRIDGREILNREVGQGNEIIEIDASHLETGMYLCKISTDQKSSTKKLIIE
jgi:photosystem II stability/assembly factor-like uncharacterized protein